MSTIYGIDENSELKSAGVQGTLVGEIKLMAADSAPANCLACDGSAISRTAYAELFSVIGTTWGSGDGSTTFNLPDLRDEWLLFAGSSHTVGADVAAGLPNISGQVVTRQLSDRGAPSEEGDFSLVGLFATESEFMCSGAFFGEWITGRLSLWYEVSEHDVSTSAGARYYAAPTIGLSAARSNAIYGASTTVQPPSRALAPYIVYAA